MTDFGFEVLTINETAQLLKCKPRTVRYYLFETNELSYTIIGREVRILMSDLEKFLQNRRKPNLNEQNLF